MEEKQSFEYFYGTEPERFKFYRVPKILIQEDEFKNLSTDAKMLYGLLLDRMALSVKNNWLDDDSRVYVYYKVSEVMDDLCCGKAKAIKLFAELLDAKLIEKHKQGLGQPDMIYVKNIFRIKKINSQKSENRTRDECEKQTCTGMKNKPLGSKIKPQKSEKQTREVRKTDTDPNNTNPNYTSLSINQSINQSNVSLYYIDVIKENIDYDTLLSQMGYDSDLVEEIFELIVETVCVQAETVKISGVDYPYELVKTRFLKLRASHIRYVVDCMKKTTVYISNVKNYLLTALYNAPSTMSNFYQQRAQHDLYG